MNQAFYVSTLFGAVTLAAALDSGAFGPHRGERLLIVSSNGGTPELGTPLHGTPAFAPLAGRFDRIVYWNDVIAPLHPSDWSPRATETPLLARLVPRALGLTAPVDELVLESVAVAPSRTLAELVRDCPITVYSDGLMSYGPTRTALPVETGGRITRLLHLDLLPGLVPLLLREFGVRPEAVPAEAFRAVLDELPALPPDPRVGGALILGQYLAELGIVTDAEEIGLYTDMLRAVVAHGHERVVFKPHPAAAGAHAPALRAAAARLDVEVDVVGGGVPAERLFATVRPDLVVGAFSTALVTAGRFFNLRAASMGTELVLAGLRPYQNSNRIPATVIDAVLPRLQPDGHLATPPQLDVQQLVDAVGYCMQAAHHADLRPAAVEWLARHGTDRYFRRSRLEAIGLVPPSRRTAARRALATQLRSTAPGTYDKLRRRYAARLSRQG